VRYIVFATLFLFACRSSTPTPPDATVDRVIPDIVDDVVEDQSVAKDVVPKISTIGAACESASFSDPGNCSQGERCLPVNDGYCIAFCAQSRRCPTGSVCVDSARLGDVCLRGCTENTDCREGFTCDPAWRACVAPGFASPRVAACTAAAPPRTRFGAVHAVTDANSDRGYDWEPSAAFLNDGRIVLAYTARTGTSLFDSSTLHVATLRNDGTTESTRSLTTERSEQYDTWMTTDLRGRAHLVWLGHNGGGIDRDSQIGYSTTEDGTTWSAPVAAHDPRDCRSADGCLDKPMITSGPLSGDTTRSLLIVCYAASGLRCRRSLDSGATFERSVFAANGFFGDVRMDARGRVHVVVTSGPGGSASPSWFGSEQNRVVYARSDDNGVTYRQISVASVTGERVPMYFSNAQVVRDEARSITYVVYPAGNDVAWNIMVATSRDDGVTWTHTRANDDAPCATHMTPAAALDTTTGALHLMWIENRDGRGAAVWTRCDAGAASCAPNERVSDEPFAAFALARQSPRWLGEYHALLVDTTRRRLHAIFTATVTESGAPIARIFHTSMGI
jgi:hypothetical protein